MANKQNKIAQVIKAKGDGSVLVLEVAEYNNDIYVTYHFLTLYFGVQIEAVKKWVVNGLEKDTEIGTFRVPMFNLRKTIVWHKKNIATSPHSKNHIELSDDDEDDLSYLEGFELLSKFEQKAFLSSSKDPIDRLKAMGDISMNKLKLDKEKGKLIDKEDVAITISEYVGIFMSQIKMDLRILPLELQNKTAHEITKFLDPHFRTTLEILKKVFVKNTGEDPRVADLFTSLGSLLKHYSVTEINSKLLEVVPKPKKEPVRKRKQKEKV